MRAGNIYITFPKGEALSGWISDFLIHLKSTIDRTTDTTINYSVKEKDFSTDNYRDYLEKSDVFIVILGTSTDDEQEYKDELSHIYKVLDIENQNPTKLSKLFKVCITPEHVGYLNESLSTVQSYNFFELSKRRQTVAKPYTFQKGETRTWAKLLDLVYDISEALSIKHKQEASENHKYIYLGNCADSEVFTRDDIKREIQHFGYRVLPLTVLPESEEYLKNIVNENLSYCKFVIQLIGENYGNIAPGAKASVYETENTAISNYLKDNKDCNRIIWIPNNLKISNQRQSLYINRLKRENSDQQTEIIETSQEDFKTILAQRVSSGNFVKEEDHTGTNAYIIVKPDSDISDIVKLSEKLNVQLTIQKPEATVNSYRNHLKNLKQAHCVLICYNNQDEKWLKSNLKDVIKSQGLEKGFSFTAIGIISDTMPDISDIMPWLPKIFHLKAGDTDSLTDFLSIAKE